MLKCGRRPYIGLVAAASLAWVVPAGATAILALWRPDVIYIAGDSAGVDGNDKPVNKRVCKIFPGQHVAIAVAGNVIGTRIRQDPKTRRTVSTDKWDFLALAHRVVQEARTVQDALESFETLGRKEIEIVVSRAEDTLPVLDVLGAGFPDGKPQIAIVAYSRSERTPGNVFVERKRTVCPPDCPPDYSPFEIGVVDPRLRLKWLELPIEIANDPVRTVDAILTRQRDETAKKHPGAIAAPFDILEITAKGMTWRRHKAECQEIPK